MVLSGKKTILYLKHKSIDIYYGGGVKVKKILFSPLALLDQEILDRKLFEKEIVNAISGIPKQNAVMMLADEILYYARFKKIEPPRIEEFIDQTPFDSDAISRKTLRVGKDFIVVAANKNYYLSVRYILERYGWRINSILPVISTSSPSQTVTYDSLRKIANNPLFVREGNFLEEGKNDHLLVVKDTDKQAVVESDSDTDEDDEDKPTSKKQYVFLALSLLFLTGAFAFAFYQMQPFGKDTNSKTSIKISPTISSSPKITGIISSTVQKSTGSAALTRQDIKIEILNGTGVAGQAGVVKSKLDELGYINSVTDNAGGTTSDNTTVNYSVRVSPGFQTEIEDTLKELFLNVIMLTNQNTSTYDAVITTGKTL